MKIAVIGANGFLGEHLVHHLSQLEHAELHLYGRAATSLAGTAHSYATLDLRDTQRIKEVFQPADVVYHLASETIPLTSWNDPMTEIEGNLIPFINLMDHLGTAGAKKLVFVSSAGTIYGPSQDKMTEESDKMPFSPYGITKLTMEHYLNYYRERSGIQYDIYRVSNVYGEGQDTGKKLGVINTFLEHIHRGEPIEIYGDGGAVRNYIYVKDLARLLGLSVTAPATTSSIYNVASHDTLSINELLTIIRSVTGIPFQELRLPGRKSDNSRIELDNSKILAAVPGFQFTPIEDGIRHTFEFIRQVVAATA